MEQLGYALVSTIGLLAIVIGVDYTKRKITLQSCPVCGRLEDKCKCPDEHMFVG